MVLNRGMYISSIWRERGNTLETSDRKFKILKHARPCWTFSRTTEAAENMPSWCVHLKNIWSEEYRVYYKSLSREILRFRTCFTAVKFWDIHTGLFLYRQRQKRTSDLASGLLRSVEIPRASSRFREFEQRETRTCWLKLLFLTGLGRIYPQKAGEEENMQPWPLALMWAMVRKVLRTLKTFEQRRETRQSPFIKRLRHFFRRSIEALYIFWERRENEYTPDFEKLWVQYLSRESKRSTDMWSLYTKFCEIQPSEIFLEGREIKNMRRLKSDLIYTAIWRK
jgi:hypothetical protein